MSNNQAGKGDRYRPVDRQKWEEGWEKAFGKKDETKKETPKTRKHGKDPKTS